MVCWVVEIWSRGGSLGTARSAGFSGVSASFAAGAGAAGCCPGRRSCARSAGQTDAIRIARTVFFIEDSPPDVEVGASVLQRTDMRQHISFAAVALLFGTAYPLITPPFEVPDEVGHFWHASSIAYGYLDRGLPVMPRGFRIIVWALWTPERGRHLTAEKMRLARGVQLEHRVRVPLRTPAYYSAAAYVPQIGAALITRVVGARPFFGFYAGRLATLSASVAFILLASWIAPQFRDHFHAASLLPLSLFLFGSWSADAMPIASGLLVTAVLLRAILSDAPMSRLEMIALICASAWLSLCKPSYILATLLALTIPRSRFESAARRFASVGILLLVVIAAATLSVWLTMSTAVAFPRSDIPVDARAQVQFIADDPLRFAGVLAHDLRVNGVDYIKTMTGRFGMYDVSLPAP